MLDRNEERVQVTKDLLKEKFGITKFPVVFRLSNRYIQYDKVNNRNTNPRGFTFDTFYNISDDEGTHLMRYYTNSTKNSRGQDVYHPADVGFNDSVEWRIDLNQMDLIHFLCEHPRCATNTNRDKSKPAWFFLENKAKDAEQKVQLLKDKNKAFNLLFGEKGALTDERVIEIARSYQVPNISGKTPNELRVELDVIAKKNTEDFLDKASTKRDLSVLNLVSKCTEAGIIKYNTHKKLWHVVDETGKYSKENHICDVRPGEDKTNRLADYLTKFDESDMIEYLTAKLEEASLVE